MTFYVVINMSLTLSIRVELDQYPRLDHQLLSNRFKNQVSHCQIIDSGCNMSDHMPLSCVLTIQQWRVAGLSELSMAKYSGVRPLYKDRWDKAGLVGYYFESIYLATGPICALSSIILWYRLRAFILWYRLSA